MTRWQSIRWGVIMSRKACLLALGLAATASSAQAATILNGGFEIGTDPGVFTTVFTGQTNIANWDVTAGSVDYIGTYWQGQGGSGRSIDLSGVSIGTISQTFATTIGQTYQVTFWVSKNPDGGNALRTGSVSAGNTIGGFSYTGANTHGNMMWAKETFLFTATGGSTTLSFSSDASGGCCFGPALDSVSITAVPEPGVWALLILGFGAVGGALRRKAQRKVTLTFA